MYIILYIRIVKSDFYMAGGWKRNKLNKRGLDDFSQTKKAASEVEQGLNILNPKTCFNIFFSLD